MLRKVIQKGTLLWPSFYARPAQPAAVLLLFVLSLPLSLSAENSSSLLLSNIHKAYTSSPSFKATFVQIYAPAGFASTSPETGRLTLQSPDQIRFDYDGPEGKVFTFDGKAARQFVAADRQMVVKTLTPEEKSRLPLLFFESPESIGERFSAAAAPIGNGIDDLTLTPKTPTALKSLVLTVTAAGEVKRLVVTDVSGNRTSFTFTQKRAGPKRPASDFALVPPDGTKVVTD
jgi:outer membrane lipoprotein carrier protein